MKKLLVGGYYDDRLFKGDNFDGKTEFNVSINTYNSEEALQLGFVSGIKEWYQNDHDKDFDDLAEGEQLEMIEQYTSTDEIAKLILFETEKEAKKYKLEVLRELRELEDIIRYEGKEQDEYGDFREVYVYQKPKYTNNISTILNSKDISIRQMSKDIGLDYSIAHKLATRNDLRSTSLGRIIEIADYLKVDIKNLYEN